MPNNFVVCGALQFLFSAPRKSMLQFFCFLPFSLSLGVPFFFAITCGLLRIGHVPVRGGVRVCGRTGMCYASTSVFVPFPPPSTLALACVDNTCVTVNLCVLCVRQGNFCLPPACLSPSTTMVVTPRNWGLVVNLLACHTK